MVAQTIVKQFVKRLPEIVDQYRENRRIGEFRGGLSESLSENLDSEQISEVAVALGLSPNTRSTATLAKELTSSEPTAASDLALRASLSPETEQSLEQSFLGMDIDTSLLPDDLGELLTEVGEFAEATREVAVEEAQGFFEWLVEALLG